MGCAAFSGVFSLEAMDRRKIWKSHRLQWAHDDPVLYAFDDPHPPNADFMTDIVGGDFGKNGDDDGGDRGGGFRTEFKMAPVVERILADFVTVGEAKDLDLEY